MKNGVFEIFDPIGVFGRELGARPSSRTVLTAILTISSLDFGET